MLSEVKIFHNGDLFRFYVDETGELIHVFFYELLGTSEKELDFDEIPDTVLTKFEMKQSK
jgi:hypothetical protein